jgi:hypothetical protein
MPTKIFAHAPKPVTKTSNSILGSNAKPQRAARQSPYDLILLLQRSVGNRASRRYLKSISSESLDIIQSDGLCLAKNPKSRPWRLLEIGMGAYGRIQRSTLKKYKRLRSKLNRKLAAIKRITSPARKKRQQIKLLRTMYNTIIGNNPFTSIQVKKISAWAETEWINLAKKNLGIKVVFNEAIFKQPLEKIVATAIHEATHAHQLKKGVNYYPSLKSIVKPKRGVYLRVVYHFAEADANLATLIQFHKALNPKQLREIDSAIGRHFKKADIWLGRMAPSFYNRPAYRLKLTQLFTHSRLKHAKTIIKLWKHNKKRSGYQNDLLPWGKLP